MNVNKKLLFGSGLTGTLCYIYNAYKYNPTDEKYTYSEISKYNNKKDGIWVTYKDSIYDVTNFIDSHPGGKDKILLAAGKSVEPYWNIYKQHTTNKEILDKLMPTMKIGTIYDYDPAKYSNFVDPYKKDPIRNSALIFHSITPCNAEVPRDQLTDNWITPNHLWYVRNHSPVPTIDIKDYKLELNGFMSAPIVLNIDNIKKFDSKTVTTTIQCGGNRRNELNSVKKTMGTPWDIGAISTAEWKGMELRDLIIQNIAIKDGKIKHIHFEGIDGVKASIPIEKVLNPYGDVILAYEMNGEELPRDHGYPLRVIVPGYVGIRNIKWLKKITLSEDEVDGTWQKGISYKGFPHYIDDVNKINEDLVNKINTVQEMPVQSGITKISNNEDKIKVEGFAWSGGGRGIIRVDVSIDEGKTWQMAELKEGSEQSHVRAWAWTFWNLEMNIPKDIENKKTVVYCKATDESYNIQPQNLDYVWNIRGLINNSWDKKEYELE
jgi:sulfite oxidase